MKTSINTSSRLFAASIALTIAATAFISSYGQDPNWKRPGSEEAAAVDRANVETAGHASSSGAVVHERWVRNDGVELFVREVGGGAGATTLLALHGGPGYSHEYMEALERIASDHLRVVTFDERGCGRSRTPAATSLTLDALISDVDAVREALSADRVVILGHSFGGFLAEAYAAAHPERVRALIAISPMPARYDDLAIGADERRARRNRLVAEGIVPKAAPPATGDDCRAEMNADLPLDFADPHHPAARTLAATTCSKHTGEATFAALGHFDLADRLRTIVVATLLVYGDTDLNLPTASLLSGYLSSAHPVLVTIAHSGHYPFLEQPDDFFARLGAFLASLR